MVELERGFQATRSTSLSSVVDSAASSTTQGSPRTPAAMTSASLSGVIDSAASSTTQGSPRTPPVTQGASSSWLLALAASPTTLVQTGSPSMPTATQRVTSAGTPTLHAASRRCEKKCATTQTAGLQRNAGVVFH
ncbi:uncharacterized protein ISCGN_009221 [Ixodes scapularis]